MPDRTPIDLRSPGRLLSGSKSDYVRRFPKNLVAFNANLVSKSRGKFWYGDVDVDADLGDLTRIAREIGETVYVLREHDARFQHEQSPRLERRIAEVRPDGTVELCRTA